MRSNPGRGLSGGDERAGGVAGVRDQAVSAAERGERVRAGWAGSGWLRRWKWAGVGERLGQRAGLAMGRAGPAWERSLGWVLGFGLLWVWGFGFSFYFSFSISSPTITQLGEFKFKIEFTTSTQTNKKKMHQHECNKILNL